MVLIQTDLRKNKHLHQTWFDSIFICLYGAWQGKERREKTKKEERLKRGETKPVLVVKYSCLGKFPVGQAELSYGKGLTPRGSDIWPE